MIVWDSREAEERSARQSLAERTRDVQRARRRIRTTAACAVISGCVVVESLWNLAFHRSVLMVVLATVGLLTGLAGLALWPPARRSALSALPVFEDRLRVAQKNDDRMFGGQR